MSNVLYGEDAVLYWCNERASAYGLSVKDFSSCWNNGRVACAVIHSLFPKEFDFYKLTFSNPKVDMKVAWDCLKKHKVIIYQEIEDMLMTKPDSKSVTLFAAELMKYSQGNYKGYDEEAFIEAKKKREEEEKRKEEEDAKRKQDAIDALPKCTLCGQPVNDMCREFCGYPYHGTCIKCTSCGVPIKFKGQAVQNKPYCELCARNAFQKLKADGWVPPKGVRGPVATMIGKFNGKLPADAVQAKPEPKKEEPKNEEDEEMRRMEEEIRRMEEEEKAEEEAMRKEEEEMKREEEELRKQEEELEEEERRMKAEEEAEEEEMRRLEAEMKALEEEN